MKDDLHSYFKAREHGILHINCDMEDKLNQLKEQFCKWYCPVKQRENEPCTKLCSECHGIDWLFCHDEMCDNCMVSNYINFIRDEL